MIVRNLVTGTSPGIVHRNGTPPDWEGRWPHIVADFFAEPIARAEPCPELTILTWSTRPEKSVLERCLDRLGVTYQTLGKRLPEWRNDMKLYLNAEALARVQSEYVMALDADDILIVSGPRQILADFQSFNCDIVFSTEKNNWPDVAFLAEFEASIAATAYRYLNSGAWIGRTAACRRFFEDCLATDTGDIIAGHPGRAAVFRDDQGVTRKMFRKYYPAAKLDDRCLLFQSLRGVAAAGEVVVGPYGQ